MNRGTKVALVLGGMGALGALTLFAIVQPTTPAVPVSVEKRADPEALERHVRMLSEEFVPRDYTHPENLKRTADYIAEQWKAAGLQVEQQSYEAEGRTYWNVVARIGAAAPTSVVVAHYDTCDELPGADDNASGVAGLIELGRILATQPPAGGIELAAVSTEEPPYFRSEHMGSAVHAEQLRRSERNIRWVISMEMIGTFVDTPDSQKFPIEALTLIYPDQGNFIAVIGDLGAMAEVRRVKAGMQAADTIPVWSMNAPTLLQGIDWSDHRSYRAQGFGAVMVTDTSYLRNFHYHTAEDTADRLDYRRMAQVVDAVAQAAVQP